MSIIIENDSTPANGLYRMETFIDPESSDNGVWISLRGGRDFDYPQDELTPDQWEQIVLLNQEMEEVIDGYIRRAMKIYMTECGHKSIQTPC